MKKTDEEIYERYFELELEMQAAKGTTRWYDRMLERKTLAWVLDIPFKL
jgi:hypothetical protein